MEEKKRYKILITKGTRDIKPTNGVLDKLIRDAKCIKPYKEELTIQELAIRLTSGCTFVAGDWMEEGTARKEKFLRTKQIVCFDVDDYITIEEFISRCKEHNLYPNFIHSSSSHLKREGVEKFRAVFAFNRGMKKDEYIYNAKLLGLKFGGFEAHKMELESTTGKRTKVLVSKGIDPASIKYNQIMNGFCNKDKSKLVYHFFHENELEVEEIPEVVLLEKRKETKRIKKVSAFFQENNDGTILEMLSDIPLIKEFREGNKDIFGPSGSGTYQNFLDVAFVFAFFKNQEEFNSIIDEHYPYRDFLSFSNLFKEGANVYLPRSIIEDIKFRSGKELKAQLYYLESDNGIYKDGNNGYIFIERKEVKSGFVFPFYKIADFIFQPVNSIVVDGEEKVQFNIFFKGKKLGDTKTCTLEVLSNRQKFQALIGKAHVSCTQEAHWQRFRKYLIEQIGYSNIVGHSFIGINKGLYIGNSRVIDSEFKNVKDNVLDIRMGRITSNLEKISFKEEFTPRFKENLFNFNNPIIVKKILGWVSGTFFQSDLDIPFPYLFVTGGAGCGKTSTGELLNNIWSTTSNKTNCCQDTMFPVVSMGGSSNLVPVWLEEFKLSYMSKYKQNELSGLLRSTYDKDKRRRGTKDLKTKETNILSPLLITGETKTEERAVRDRSISIDLVKDNVLKHRDVFNSLKNDHIKDLNLLGSKLLHLRLNTPKKEIVEVFNNFSNQLLEKIPDDRIRRNNAWLLTGLYYLNKIISVSNPMEIISIGELEENINPKTQLEEFQEMLVGLFGSCDRDILRNVFEVHEGGIVLKWQNFYALLSKSIREERIEYEQLTNRNLLRLVKTFKGIRNIETFRNGFKVKGLFIPLELEKEDNSSIF